MQAKASWSIWTCPRHGGPGREQKRVNVDFPDWMVRALDSEAERLGVSRQSLIKIWIAERIESTTGQ